MKVLITGGNGFVGSAVVRRFLQAGYRVRVLVRRGSSKVNLENLPVERCEGDLNHPSSLRKALRGCDGLVHAAADYRLWVPRPRQMYATNVTGTRELMQAALEAGVERIVYTSSVATLGRRPDRRPADETVLGQLGDMIGHYKRSKFLAEQEVRRLVAFQQLPAVIVSPSTPVGPRDVRPTPTGRMVLDAATGHMPAYVDTGLNLVHVDDVAHGHLLAFEKGRTGENYILGGEDLTLYEIFSEIAAMTGHRPPTFRIRPQVLLPFAYLSEALAHFGGGKEPRLTLAGIRLSRHHMYFCCDKAKRELGYRPGPAREALAEAIEWFRDFEFGGRKGKIPEKLVLEEGI